MSRRHTARMLALGLGLAAGAAFAAPPDVVPGRTYAGGTAVSFPALGVTVVLPDAWQGVLTPSGDAFVLGSETEPGLLLMIAEPGSSAASLRMALSEPLPLDDATTLVPEGDPAPADGGLETTYTVAGQPGLRGLARGFVTARGTAIGLVAVGPADRLGAYRSTLRAMAHSISEHAPRAHAPAESGDWAARLRGMALVSMQSGDGHARKRQISFCSDGEYRYADDESYASSDAIGDFSYAGAGGDRGRWRVEGGVLLLSSADGPTSRHVLERRGEQTFMDGERWLLVDRSVCP